MIVQSILGPRGLAIVADVGFVLACVAFLWGAIKLAYQRTQGQAMPRNLFTKVLDVGVEAFNIVWGTINRAVKLDTGRGLFLPTLPADGSPPSSSAAAIASQAAELSQLRDELSAYQRRVGESHAVTAPARQTIVPEVAAQIASETLPRDNPERGSISLRALLVVALLSLVALAASCIPARRFVLDRTDGVPARVACTPRTQACLSTDAGMLPVVCSDEGRQWPTLSRRPDGTQRTCAPGEGCTVDADSGIANCTAAADGGVR